MKKFISTLLVVVLVVMMVPMQIAFAAGEPITISYDNSNNLIGAGSSTRKQFKVASVDVPEAGYYEVAVTHTLASGGWANFEVSAGDATTELQPLTSGGATDIIGQIYLTQGTQEVKMYYTCSRSFRVQSITLTKVEVVEPVAVGFNYGTTGSDSLIGAGSATRKAWKTDSVDVSEAGYYEVVVEHRVGNTGWANFEVATGNPLGSQTTTGLQALTPNPANDSAGFYKTTIGQVRLGVGTQDVRMYYTSSSSFRVASITLIKVADLTGEVLTPEVVEEVDGDAPAYYYEALTEAVSGKNAFWNADVRVGEDTKVVNKCMAANVDANIDGPISLYLVYQGTEATISNVRLIWE